MNKLVTLDDKKPTLKEAQKIVGGYVEMVSLSNGDQLLVDEDGLSKNLPINPDATALVGGLIVGPALLLRGTARWID